MSKSEDDDFSARLSALRIKLYGETANYQASLLSAQSASSAAAPGTNDVDDLTTRFHSLFGTAPIPSSAPAKTIPPITSGGQGDHDDFEDDALDDEAWDRLVSGGDGTSGLKDIVEDMTGTKDMELKHEDWHMQDILKATKDSAKAANSEKDEIARLLNEAQASLEVPTTKGIDNTTDDSKLDPAHEDEDKVEDELSQITKILNQARDAAALEAEEEKKNPKPTSRIPSTPPPPYTSDADIIMPPSPPKSNIEPIATTTRADPITDDELSLRLLNLRRDMPTQSLPFHEQPTKDSTAEESDDEMWCTMCAMDAEFRCSGCDGEVYCENCLWESHQGPNAGWEEKRHKWTRMEKGGRKVIGVGG